MIKKKKKTVEKKYRHRAIRILLYMYFKQSDLDFWQDNLFTSHILTVLLHLLCNENNLSHQSIDLRKVHQ